MRLSKVILRRFLRGGRRCVTWATRCLNSYGTEQTRPSALPISPNWNGPASRFLTHPMLNVSTIEDFISVPADAWPALHFSAIPAIKTLRAQYPVHHLWSGEKSLEVTAAETSLRVWRANDCRVFHAPMDERESAAIQKMISGEPFATICETFADLPEAGAAQESAALLVRWIEDGIIHRIDQAA